LALLTKEEHCDVANILEMEHPDDLAIFLSYESNVVLAMTLSQSVGRCIIRKFTTPLQRVVRSYKLLEHSNCQQGCSLDLVISDFTNSEGSDHRAGL